MNTSGKIVVLAYPDTFVKMSEEWICKFLPLVGLGTKEYIKAGHAALVLVENQTGKAFYHDFGRYITPKGYGRVRSAVTDVELEIPFLMDFDLNNNLKNLNKLLLWLEAHPEKTHGEGRLLASVCENVDFNRAKLFIAGLQKQGSIPYGAFDKKGSNCARFVTDTILEGTSERKIQKALKFNKKFTPSTVGNVEKAASFGNIYEVFNGKIKLFKGSAFKENLKNYFHKKKVTEAEKTTFSKVHENLQKLEGIGSSAYFEVLKDENLPQHHFRIKRFTEHFEEDFDGVYFSEKFSVEKPFQFTYDSHCAYCHVMQEEQKVKLEMISKFQNFNS